MRVPVLCFSAATIAALGCSSSDSASRGASAVTGSTGVSGSTETGTVTGGSGGDAAVTGTPCDICTDFPAAPIVDANSADAAGQFTGDAPDPAAGGPCLLEPDVSGSGVLFPSNWQRPRFRWTGSSGDAYELRLRSAHEANDLVVYTASTSWTMPRDIWKNLARHVQMSPIRVSLRAAGGGGGFMGSFQIAPVAAKGSIVHWAMTGPQAAQTGNDLGQSWLEGFGIGDEGVVKVLTIPQINAGPPKAPAVDSSGNKRSGTGAILCVGCHTITPDPNVISFVDHVPWGDVLAAVEPATVGKPPDWLSPQAAAMLEQPWLGPLTYSSAYFSANGSRLAVGALGRTDAKGAVTSLDGTDHSSSPTAQLVWLDLNTSTANAVTDIGTTYSVIARTGDSNGAAMPSFSHDGTRIVYVSTRAWKDGRLGGNGDPGPQVPMPATGDLYVVDFNARVGGAALPLSGAASTDYNEYYPSFSPDDRFVAYNRAPVSVSMYNQPESEVFVVPADGGQAIALDANQPPVCSGVKSPGITNSWAKWAPEAATVDGRTYYFLVFSSQRDGHMLPNTTIEASQLYATAIVVEGGQITTFKAIYPWNQNPDEGNLTPSWDYVNIPDVPTK